MSEMDQLEAKVAELESLLGESHQAAEKKFETYEKLRMHIWCALKWSTSQRVIWELQAALGILEAQNPSLKIEDEDK